MSSSYYGDAVVSTGEYIDNNSGQTKKRWTKVGAMFRDTESGNISIKFDVLPMPKNGECWVKIFKKDEQPQQAAPPQAVAPPVTQQAARTLPDITGVEPPPMTERFPSGGVEEDDIPF